VFPIKGGTMRKITLSLEPIAGGITLFYAFVNGEKVIKGEDGSKKRVWNGQIADSQVKLKVRVIGIDTAQYKLGIDLPGTAEDQSMTFSLQGGYHETEILL
jgi:hypothetical protein